MTRTNSRRPTLLPTNAMTDHSRLLVIGNCPHTLGHARSLAADRIEVPGLGGLFSAYWSGGAPPDIVMAPLLSGAFDIMDIIDRLLRFGFRGRLVAVASQLPNARAVRREVGAECQGFHFDLVEVATRSEPSSNAAP